MASARELFINAVKLISIRGSANIPTVLFYHGRDPLIGYDALERAGGTDLLNEDFKLDLGRYDPGSIDRARFDTAGGQRRTAVGLANDFVNIAIQHVSKSLAIRGLTLPKRVLVAEPISIGKLQGENDAWLANIAHRSAASYPESLTRSTSCPSRSLCSNIIDMAFVIH
jgi:hypothetical protein